MASYKMFTFSANVEIFLKLYMYLFFIQYIDYKYYSKEKFFLDLQG